MVRTLADITAGVMAHSRSRTEASLHAVIEGAFQIAPTTSYTAVEYHNIRMEACILLNRNRIAGSGAYVCIPGGASDRASVGSMDHEQMSQQMTPIIAMTCTEAGDAGSRTNQVDNQSETGTCPTYDSMNISQVNGRRSPRWDPNRRKTQWIRQASCSA